jgi:hypothetical protein
VKRKTAINQCVTGLVLALISIGANADLFERGFNAEFAVHYNDMYLGTTQRVLRPDEDDTWHYNATTEPKGFVSLFISDVVHERSLLKKVGYEIRPLRYVYDQTGGKREEHYQIDFDWHDHLIKTTGSDENRPLKKNSQDLMTFQLQLMQDLQRKKKDIRYHIVDDKHIRLYTLSAPQKVRIDTPVGKLTTLRLIAQSKETKYHFKLWCAEALHYLPVKVQKVEEDGDVTELVLRKFKPL